MVLKQVQNSHGILILIVMKDSKVMTQEIWKMLILCLKTSKEFYHHIKFRKIVMNRRWSIKSTVIKKFAIFTGKQLCWSPLFNKNEGLQAYDFIKKRLQHRCFLDNTAKILRTAFWIAILKNICEQLLLRVFPFMLVWTFSYMSK